MWRVALAFDESLFRFINIGWASPALDRIMSVVSDKYLWLVIGVLAAIALFLKFKSRMNTVLLVLLIALALTDSITYQILKPAFSRMRPCKQLTEIHLVPEYCGGDYGFPSNHAANGMAVTTVLTFMLSRSTAAIALGLTLLVGLSRVYLGVHFPGDVVGGYLVGALVATVVVFVFQILQKKRRQAVI
ncbi:MAG: phosphatase PAP2 family protein [Deltaproteobacteria bacterium]|nr:phosphatase PAP2 family protein [Deltaproteobacteria bacterium]